MTSLHFWIYNQQLFFFTLISRHTAAMLFFFLIGCLTAQVQQLVKPWPVQPEVEGYAMSTFQGPWLRWILALPAQV